MKVSYCTTCKGRLHHLQQTLPHNLEAEKDNPDVEFVVLDYTSEDGLAEWIKQNYSKEVASGRIRYARYDDGEHFKMAHAKNMAHRLATGDILCNLDADNMVVPNFSRYLNEVFTKNPNSIIGRSRTNPIHYLTTLNRKPLPSVTGRIAMMRECFEALTGYDEAYSAWGGDDDNLCKRAEQGGMKLVQLPNELAGSALSHSDDDRVENLAPDDKHKSRVTLGKTKWQWRRGSLELMLSHPEPRANSDGRFGCGNVRINFSDEVTSIDPVNVPKRTKHTTRIGWGETPSSQAR